MHGAGFPGAWKRRLPATIRVSAISARPAAGTVLSRPPAQACPGSPLLEPASAGDSRYAATRWATSCRPGSMFRSLSRARCSPNFNLAQCPLGYVCILSPCESCISSSSYKRCDRLSNGAAFFLIFCYSIGDADTMNVCAFSIVEVYHPSASICCLLAEKKAQKCVILIIFVSLGLQHPQCCKLAPADSWQVSHPPVARGNGYPCTNSSKLLRSKIKQI